MSETLRVLTFNLLAYSHASGPERHEVVRRGLADLRPDVVAFQEVTRTATFDQAADLLGPEFSIIEHPGRGPDGVGACLATRWPSGRIHTLDLHTIPGAEALPWAATVAVEVNAPSPLGPLWVVHHKPNWQLDREYVRENQAVAAARFVEEIVGGRSGMPVVLLGDFDAAPEASSTRFWTGRQSLGGMSVRYDDAWEARHPGVAGHTFTPRNPLVRDGEMPLERGRRIDHIMVRCEAHGAPLEVVECRLVFDEPDGDVWTSDHFGVLAVLRRTIRRPGLWHSATR